MQLIEETVSPHLRELELSFYGKAEGSIQRDSITLLQQWRKRSLAGRLFQVVQANVIRRPKEGWQWAHCRCHCSSAYCISWDLWAPTGLDDSQTHREEVLPIARSTTLLKSKARGGAIPASFLIVLALSPSNSQVPVLPCIFPHSFLSSGFAVGAMQLPS